MSSPRVPRVVVLGAVHVDTTVRVDHMPDPGETIVSTGTSVSGGGKGANQAVAAAAVDGVEAHLVSAVGDDEGGREQLAELARAGVGTYGVARVDGESGGAIVLVDDDGENTIVVVPGADAAVATWSADQLPDDLGPADVLVGQTEVGRAAVLRLAEEAERTGARLVVNNGPAEPLRPELYALCDPLVVNEGEARLSLSFARHRADPSDAATLREALGCRSVVVTRGGDGAEYADASGSGAVPAVPVDDVVDTTGAGDVFVGTLAARLALGSGLAEAVEAAGAAAAESVGWEGARRPR
jgi:ribokinase